jgi:hypothetical protein
MIVSQSAGWQLALYQVALDLGLLKVQSSSC